MKKKTKVETATEKSARLHKQIGKLLQEYHDLGAAVGGAGVGPIGPIGPGAASPGHQKTAVHHQVLEGAR